MKSRVAVFAFVVLLATSLPAGAVTLESGSAIEPSATADSASGSELGSSRSLASVGTSVGADDVFHRTTVLRHRPDDPETFGTEMTFRVPDPVTEFEIELERGATVESVAGFERTGERTFQWDEETAEPTIRYAMPADQRGGGEQRGTDSSAGYTFVDTGEWGVVGVPDVAISLRRTEPVGIEETVTVDGLGATGGDIAFFGEVQEYERDVDGETFRLAVPEVVDLEESPDAILTALADASGRLEVGMRSDEVFMVAVPSDVDWGSNRGIQYGQSDAWVVEDATLDERNPVWFHEYVHVRQRFSATAVATAPEADWIVEGQADYYAGLLALESGRTEFGEFSTLLERGQRSRYTDGVLTDRSTWDDPETDYAKGALVAGEIDRRLRLATDGDRTLEDVFRTLNAREETVTQTDFLRAVEDAGGAEVRAAAERYTQTEATPEMWNRSQHEAAFGQSVAAFEYETEAESLTVAGQEWPRWSTSDLGRTDGEDRAVIAVPAGESVTIPTTVENTGKRAGTYDATLQAGGRVVDSRRGTLEPGATATHALSWTPSEPGEYTIRIGSERLTAVVRSSGSVAVTDVQHAPDGIDAGESVTATATIEAAGDRPGAAVLAFRTVDGVVAERPVAIRPGETTTVDAEIRFDEDGRYEIAVHDRVTTIDVGGGAVAGLEAVPGFGVPAALVAVAAALLGALVARHR
ncbi:CARDB domain-containing protein [Natrinema versiforme]|uniref:CARDB domain-containing protein n=1 Tax=Natrinema versiforme TaxID=88724 RepID=A0A4V1FX80_9EURY|nr:CARDB domain-containing protein [Natrinema versiforme]QCS40881.1 hypothetical protein FEJ81_00435 [Natrinema versiforme]